MFVELVGAGVIGKALSFFPILNKSKTSRVDRSRIIRFKNMRRGGKSAVQVTQVFLKY